MKTLKNKIVLVLLLILGYIPAKLTGDATALAFIFIFFAPPLAFSKRNIIN